MPKVQEIAKPATAVPSGNPHDHRRALSAEGQRPAVLIIGPPWPRSGTARVIQNQIAYYRSRGYQTLFVCVGIHCSFTPDNPLWGEVKTGMEELGADYFAIASINYRRFLATKYTAWIRHAFRGTALDWVVNTGKSADLSLESLGFLQKHPLALVHVNHVFTLGFAQRLLRQLCGPAQVPLILETHDIQSHLLEQRKDLNPWTHKLDPREKLLHSELRLLKKPQVLVHCSADDCNFFRQHLPAQKHVLVLPTIDEAFISAVNDGNPPTGKPIDLLFVGQSNDPNLWAMRWFFEQVWPLIADRGYQLKIVGPIDMLVRKSFPEIYKAFSAHFVGPASNLVPFYRSARCVIAPMVSGTGISIKTIEALGLAKPFVGTSKAFRGMPIERIHSAGLQSYDEPQAYADAVAHALANPQMAASVSRAAYEALFSRQAAFSSRDAALQLVLSSCPSV